MGAPRAALAALFAVALAGGCSLLINFDPEGQPCNNGACLRGFRCLNGRCTQDGGGCQFRRCAVGQYCRDDAGAPSCLDISQGEPGQLCRQDIECGGGNRFCYRGAIQSYTTGSSRTGACVQRCNAGDPPCPAGTSCTFFPLGLDAGGARLCMAPRTLFSCLTESDCLGDDLTCTVFDHPMVGPSTLCDSPLLGAKIGERCTSTADGGAFCQNGLCVPREPSPQQIPRCAEPCDGRGAASTCPSGQRCELVELTVKDEVRYLPMCVEAVTLCGLCSASAPCGPDAPRCTLLGGARRCLGACSASLSCPPGQVCSALDGGSRCIPQAGFCP